MKLKEQVCSLKLAKQLKELGVKQKSLFYWGDDSWKKDCELTNKIKYHIYFRDAPYKKGEYNPDPSAFTVAELGEMLPHNRFNLGEVECFLSVEILNNVWDVCYIKYGIYKTISKRFTDKSEANARAKMLIHLLKNKLL